MTDLDKAREWAKRRVSSNYFNAEQTQAAVDIIQSLPDQWADAEKVRDLIDLYKHARDSNAEGTEGWVINHLMVSNLESLIPTPKLPTLADMTQEERKACQWMQARLDGSELDFVIPNPGVVESMLWAKDGTTHIASNNLITPLTGEPKHEWPGSASDDVAYATGGVITTQDVVDECRAVRKERANTTPTLPRPEDVPANEPWLIEVDGQKAIGTRHKGNTIVPWSVAALDGSFAGDFHDNEVTLIHKLVPEPPALPEGMRFADHKEYGRVVVAPRANTHGEEYFYRLREDNPWGASHGYRPTEEFSFLDGDQHA